MPLERVVHAMKATKRSGRVRFVSVAFAGAAVVITEEFRTRLRSKLARRVQQNGRFEVIHRPGHTDWFIIFAGTWPERELDEALNATATELGAKMFMDPAIPVAEMTADMREFMRTVNIRRDRPTN